MVGVLVGAIIMGLVAFPALAHQFRGIVNAGKTVPHTAANPKRAAIGQVKRAAVGQAL